MQKRYQVLVGNVGQVYCGLSFREANAAYTEYCRQADAQYGRASGEAVTLLRGDEILAMKDARDDEDDVEDRDCLKEAEALLAEFGD